MEDSDFLKELFDFSGRNVGFKAGFKDNKMYVEKLDTNFFWSSSETFMRIVKNGDHATVLFMDVYKEHHNLLPVLFRHDFENIGSGITYKNNDPETLSKLASASKSRTLEKRLNEYSLVLLEKSDTISLRTELFSIQKQDDYYYLKFKNKKSKQTVEGIKLQLDPKKPLKICIDTSEFPLFSSTFSFENNPLYSTKSDLHCYEKKIEKNQITIIEASNHLYMVKDIDSFFGKAYNESTSFIENFTVTVTENNNIRIVLSKAEVAVQDFKIREDFLEPADFKYELREIGLLAKENIPDEGKTSAMIKKPPLIISKSDFVIEMTAIIYREIDSAIPSSENENKILPLLESFFEPYSGPLSNKEVCHSISIGKNEITNIIEFLRFINKFETGSFSMKFNDSVKKFQEKNTESNVSPPATIYNYILPMLDLFFENKRITKDEINILNEIISQLLRIRKTENQACFQTKALFSSLFADENIKNSGSLEKQVIPEDPFKYLKYYLERRRASEPFILHLKAKSFSQFLLQFINFVFSFYNLKTEFIDSEVISEKFTQILQ